MKHLRNIRRAAPLLAASVLLLAASAAYLPPRTHSRRY
jgi:hypothetical protein